MLGFVAAHGLSVVCIEWGAYSHFTVHRYSHSHGGFLLYGAEAIGTWASVVAIFEFSIYGTWT